MNEQEQKLRELEAYKNRLQSDLTRANMSGGVLDRNAPLRRNYNNVVQEINKIKHGQ